MPDGPLHKNFTATNLHVPGYQQSSDPGAVGAGKYWVDTTGGTGAWALKVRNAGDSGWETVATAGASLTAASQAQQETGTDVTVGVTPGRQQYHPSAAKAWAVIDGTGTAAVLTSYNLTSITDQGTGDYTATWNVDFSSVDYAIAGSALRTKSGGGTQAQAALFSLSEAAGNPAVGSTRVWTLAQDGTAIDADVVSIICYGDQ